AGRDRRSVPRHRPRAARPRRAGPAPGPARRRQRHLRRDRSARPRAAALKGGLLLGVGSVARRRSLPKALLALQLEPEVPGAAPAIRLTVSMVSASSARLSSRWRTRRAKRSARPAG